MDAPAHPRIVVVGEGFGGLWAARRLVRHGLAVTVLDRNNYHTFFPLLYQVAAAELSQGEIAYPIRSLFRKEPLVDFRKAELRELDLRSKGIVTDRGALQYDYLILALGSVPNFFGVEGAASQSFPPRTMDDAIALRYQVLACFERAAQELNPEERRALLRFAIVGGGHTGVAYAGALAELIYGPLLKDCREIPPEEVHVTLLEGGDRLLPGMPVRLQEYARALGEAGCQGQNRIKGAGWSSQRWSRSAETGSSRPTRLHGQRACRATQWRTGGVFPPVRLGVYRSR